MKRTEAWWVNFDPSIAGEIRKKRFAVMVSIDASNRFLNRVQVAGKHPSSPPMTGLPLTREAVARTETGFSRVQGAVDISWPIDYRYSEFGCEKMKTSGSRIFVFLSDPVILKPLAACCRMAGVCFPFGRILKAGRNHPAK